MHYRHSIKYQYHLGGIFIIQRLCKVLHHIINGYTLTLSTLKPQKPVIVCAKLLKPHIRHVRVLLSKYRNDYRIQRTWWKRRSMKCGVRSLSKHSLFFLKIRFYSRANRIVPKNVDQFIS
jgi:hypothetical protein